MQMLVSTLVYSTTWLTPFGQATLPEKVIPYTGLGVIYTPPKAVT